MGQDLPRILRPSSSGLAHLAIAYSAPSAAGSAPPSWPQDMTDSVFAESEQARALREIRSRDPSFDMVRFLQHLRADVRVLIKVSRHGVRWRGL